MGIENENQDNVYLDNQRTKIEAVQMGNLPGKEQLTRESSEQLSHLETQLTGESLKEIGITRTKAFASAKEFFGISDPVDFNNFKNLIEDFQRKNGLEIDGKIGKRTYMEMHTQRLIPIIEATTKLKDVNNKIDEQTIKYIEFSNSNPFASANTQIELAKKIAEYKKVTLDTDVNFNSRVDKSMGDGAKALQKDEKTQEVLNKKSNTGASLYEDFRDLGAKDALSKHSGELKLVGIAMFIFGVIPGLEKIPGCNTWYGRLAWLFGGAYLGGGALIEDIISKGGEIAGEGYESAKKGVQEGYKTVKNGAQKGMNEYETPALFKNLVKNVSDKSGELTTSVKESYDAALKSFNSINQNNKNNPEKYVTDFSLVSDKINNDPKFMNIEISELEKNKNDITVLKGYLSNKLDLFPVGMTQEQINVREKDIKNYVSLLLSKDRNPGDRYVKNIIVSQGIIDKANEKFASANVGYTENTKANKDLQGLVGNISDSRTKSEVIGIIMNITNIEKGNDKTNYEKLSDYLNKNTLISSNDKLLVENILKTIKSEIVYHEAIDAISTILVVNNNVEVDTLDSINRKVVLLDSIKTEFSSNKDRLASSDNTTIDKMYNDKKFELYKKGSELEGGTGKYTTDLNNLEKNSKLSNDEENIKKFDLLLQNIPTAESKPKDFEAFFNSTYTSYKTISEFGGKYVGLYNQDSKEFQIKINLESTITKYESAVKNYEIVKKSYVEKVKNVRERIDGISVNENISTDELKSKKIELQNILHDFELIASEIISSHNYIDDLEVMWNKYIKGEITIKDTDNYFERIDKIVGSNEHLPIISTLLSDIHIKTLDIELNYNPIIDITDLNILDDKAVSNVVNSILKQKEVLSSLNINDSIVQDKDAKLKDIVRILVMKYENALDNSPNFVKVKSIYDLFVKNNLSSLIPSNKIDEIFKKRIDEDSRKEYLSKNLSEKSINDLVSKSGAKDFFIKYENVKRLKDINESISLNTTLDDIISIFRSISEAKLGYTDEQKTDAKKIYDDLNNNVSIELKGYINTYLERVQQKIQDTI